jgi:hypothetical protein
MHQLEPVVLGRLDRVHRLDVFACHSPHPIVKLGEGCLPAADPKRLAQPLARRIGDLHLVELPAEIHPGIDACLHP